MMVRLSQYLLADDDPIESVISSVINIVRHADAPSESADDVDR